MSEIEIQKTNKTIIQKKILITRVNHLMQTATQKSGKLEIKHLKNSLIITLALCNKMRALFLSNLGYHSNLRSQKLP